MLGEMEGGIDHLLTHWGLRSRPITYLSIETYKWKIWFRFAGNYAIMSSIWEVSFVAN